MAPFPPLRVAEEQTSKMRNGERFKLNEQHYISGKSGRIFFATVFQTAATE
jgi:hypothetical protein